LRGRALSDDKAKNFPEGYAVELKEVEGVKGVKKLTAASLPQIGKSFGGKHHSTVIHSIRKVEGNRKTDAAFNTLIDNFLQSFN